MARSREPGALRRLDCKALRHERAIVIASLPPSARLDGAELAVADLAVAADGGVNAAYHSGRAVDAVIGDMDSADPDALQWAKLSGARIEVHEARKDQTDLELALAFACRRAENVHVVASAQARLDHALANLAVLSSVRWADTAVSATVDAAQVDVIRGRRVIGGATGDVVSLLACGGPAHVVETVGLEYRLLEEWLDPCEARGVSNVVVAPPVIVEVSEGAVLAIRPASSASRE